MEQKDTKIIVKMDLNSSIMILRKNYLDKLKIFLGHLLWGLYMLLPSEFLYYCFRKLFQQN